jgi:signal transduction histidine kinase
MAGWKTDGVLTENLPGWLKNLLLGNIPAHHRRAWLMLLWALLVLVPFVDYSLGRSAFHLNLYPVPVALSIFLFGYQGLFSVLVLLVSYHVVQVGLDLEPHAVLLNNLGQLALTSVVGLLCTWLVGSYRALYEGEAKLATTRHELLLSLTHELRNPLFAVRGIVRNLARNYKRVPEDQVVAQLNEAQAAIATINRDVEGLTQVFRVDLCGLEAQISESKVGDLFNAVLKRHPLDFAPGHPISVRDGCQTDATVFVDPLLVQQSLDNLVSNAIRHTEGGHIQLDFRRDQGRCIFSVEDEGAGVPTADRERIFERHDQGARRAATGFGVGLYLVRIYAEAQGGRVRVEKGKVGARFVIDLPEDIS